MTPKPIAYLVRLVRFLMELPVYPALTTASLALKPNSSALLARITINS